MPEIARENEFIRARPAIQNRSCGKSLLVFFGVGVILFFLLEALSAPTFTQSRYSRSKVVRAKGDLQYIANQVKLFRAEQSRYPDSLGDLVTRPSHSKDWPEGGFLERLPKDPWGGEYILKIPGDHWVDFDIITYGGDNMPGGEGYDADLSCQSQESAPEKR